MLRRLLLVVALAAAAQGVPTLAAGTGPVRSAVSQVRLADRHTVQALAGERMVAVTWTSGAPRISYRWHLTTGWSSWLTAVDDSADSPIGTPGTEPLWRPPTADRVELSFTGTALGAQLVRVADHQGRLSLRRASAATGRELLGAVHPRADWGADESLRTGSPSYAARVDAVVVHHTAAANGYQPADVPSLIRADYAYHVQTRGWLDIGYNLLVDQFGGIWEGRAGGLGRATIGAHAEGFNTGTLGVAVIGDLTTTTATPAAERALAHVIAYAARTWGFDPTGSVTLTSRGSPRFASGRRVSMSRVFGHQQTGSTACPGSLEERLPALRALAKIGLGPGPAITRVTVSGAPVHAPTPLVVDGQLSRAATWAVHVVGSDGSTAAAATGSGTAPHLSWNGFVGLLPALPGSYEWVLTADDGFHPPVRRSGTVDVGLPLLA